MDQYQNNLNSPDMKELEFEHLKKKITKPNQPLIEIINLFYLNLLSCGNGRA